MKQVEIYNLKQYNIAVAEIVKLVKSVLKKENKADSYLNIILTDNVTLQKLNKKYRQQAKTTDVLSFPFGDDFSLMDQKALGDIYISVPQAEKQAKEYNHSLRREIAFLTTHGVYHLLGYNHDDDNAAKKMFEKQEEVLKKHGFER